MVLSGDILSGGEIPIMPGKLHKYSATVDIRAFYMELHAWLVKKKFKDVKGYGGHAKKGEFVDNGDNLNRTADMYENEFIIINKGDVKEMEIRWEAQISTPHSPYGKVYFKLDLVVRNMKDVEILEGNKKKVMQTGSWEFRNKIIYKNDIKKKLVDKIPIIKNSPKLQQIYMDRFQEENLYYDFLEFGIKKMKAAIMGIIEKHFT